MIVFVDFFPTHIGKSGALSPSSHRRYSSFVVIVLGFEHPANRMVSPQDESHNQNSVTPVQSTSDLITNLSN